ncbi:hypothetical protein ACMSDU_22405 [Bacteroides thetaiotaomicron]|uniref:hypothetical protein n=1 Tax=Bacteroides thetaiotaomicron TaxID=818 RepID=UPI0039C02117
MNEPICVVCGETDIKKLAMFNYGVCLCHRCLEISAHSFIHDNAERKLKETEKKKESVDVEGMSKQEYESMKELKDEIAKKIWDEITEKIKKKREADAKKMAKSSEEIGKAIFVEQDCQPESINDLKKALDKVKADLHTYKAMYRNRLGKFANLMNEHKKLTEDRNKVIKAQDSLTTNFINAQLDANRYRRKYDELCEEFCTKLKVCNTWMLVASAASLLVGVALGYGLR